MTRLAGILLLAVSLTGCGNDITEYEISSQSIDQFMDNAEALSARDDDKAPLAMSVLANNKGTVPPGVQIWNPDKTMQSVGIVNGDVITLVDEQLPSRDYGHAFAPDQEPFGSATEQYVHFVSGLLAKRNTQESVLLAVHARYGTMAERKEHGRIHSKDPRLIRIVFR